jgi:hypothetical protein
VLTSRSDTKYWQDNLNRSTDFKNKNRTIHSNRLEEVRLNKTKYFNSPSIGGTTWISAGMNFPLIDIVSTKLGEISNLMNYEIELNNDFNNLKEKQQYWDKEALLSPTLFKYLKDNYYD